MSTPSVSTSSSISTPSLAAVNPKWVNVDGSAAACQEPTDQPQTNSSTEDLRLTQRHVDPRSFMERWMATDSDSVSVLLQYLQLSEIARQNSVCKAWRNFIAHPPNHLIPSFQYSLAQPFAGIKSKLSHEPHWLKYFVKIISVHLGSYKQDTGAQQLHDLMLTLPYFDHLTSLNLRLKMDLLIESDLAACLSSMHRSLKKVTFDCWYPFFGMSMDGPTLPKRLQTIFNALAGLSNLEALVIQGGWSGYRFNRANDVSQFQSLNFSTLIQLKKLRSFEFAVGVPCSKAQIEQLVQCESLTHLSCGIMVGSHQPSADKGRSRKKWIEEGVAKLKNLKHLQQLNIAVSQETLHADCLIHLCQMPALTAIQPQHWDELITASEYSDLKQLQHLQKISWSIDSEDEEEDSINPHFWATLIQLSSLISVSLGGVKLNKVQLTQFFTGLPDLQELEFTRVRLQSLAPFVHAKQLRKLRVEECSDLKDGVIRWAKTMPILSELTRFEIREDWMHDIDWPESISDSSYLIWLMQQTLAQRFPKLTLENVIVR